MNQRIGGRGMFVEVAIMRPFLATLVALHFTPVSKSVSQSVIKWAEFRTSVASRLASLFSCPQQLNWTHCLSVPWLGTTNNQSLHNITE